MRTTGYVSQLRNSRVKGNGIRKASGADRSRSYQKNLAFVGVEHLTSHDIDGVSFSHSAPVLYLQLSQKGTRENKGQVEELGHQNPTVNFTVFSVFLFHVIS